MSFMRNIHTYFRVATTTAAKSVNPTNAKTMTAPLQRSFVTSSKLFANHHKPSSSLIAPLDSNATVLIETMMRKDYGALRRLVKVTKGVNVDSQTIEGQTALIHAASRGDLDGVEHLLSELNANPSIMNSKQETALHHAVEKGHVKVVEALLKFGAKPSEVKFDINAMAEIKTLLDKHQSSSEDVVSLHVTMKVGR